jgi:hypothetical protein
LSVILIQENNQGSAPDMFRAMIEAAGLSLVAAHGGEPRVTPYTRIYYLAVMRRGDAPPAWLTAKGGKGVRPAAALPQTPRML